MVELSIIMPVYNGETYLRQAIDSILNQTYTNFELIVIDDASTDGTAKIIRSYNDPRIKVIRNLDQQGNYPSRNKGQDIAIGKYFCVMDADDISYPRRLEVQYTYMENHPDILAIGTSFDFSISGLKRDLPLTYEQIQLALLDNNSFLHPSIMVRADVMRMHGGYNEKYIYSSDYDLMARLALSGKVENLPDVLMMYQCHECQISQKYKREQEMYADEIRRKYQIEFINRYKTKEMTSPDEWAIGYPLLGKIIALYTYANFTCKPEYEEIVSDLWDSFLKNNICIIPSLGKEVSLCCLGCGLIYILRNGLADEDENEILADLDSRLTDFNLKWQNENNKALMGWIHYLTLRIEKNDSPLLLQNKVNLIQLLDQVSEEKITNGSLLKDIQKLDSYKLFPVRTKHLLNTASNADVQTFDKVVNDYVTFLIPFRIDSFEQARNLDNVLEILSKRKRTKILLLEADTGSIYKNHQNYPNVYYQFVQDENPIFYKAKYLNELLHTAKSSIVGIWDTDVIATENQIEQAITTIIEGKAVISFPHDGRLQLCSMEKSIRIHNKRSKYDFTEKGLSSSFSNPVYGAFFVNKKAYLDAGGENEHFYGWGLEDRERVYRMEILGLPITRVNGPLFHMHHPKYESSCFTNIVLTDNSRKEIVKVCGMAKEQLRQYISTWNNIASQYSNKIFVPLIQDSMKIPSDYPLRSPFFENYFCIMEKYNLAFVAISKNGVTHLKNILIYSHFGFYPDQYGAHSLIGYNDASPFLCPVNKIHDKEKETGKMIKFAVWRDPVERLISCYKYFCLEREDRYYFRFLNLYQDKSFGRFMEFVRFELGKKDPLYQDEHIRKQSDYYNPEDVDYIVPIHKLNQFLEEHGVPVLKKTANETSTKFQITDQRFIAEIKELYKSDYEIEVTY